MNKKTQNTARTYYALFWIFLMVIAACVALMIFQGMSPGFFAVNEIMLLLSMGLYVLYKKRHYTEAIEMINTTAANIEDTHLKLAGLNEHLQALNDFSKDLSERDDKTEICKLVTRTLVNKFNYDSSQFWLFNPGDNCLEFASAAGNNDSTIHQFIADQAGRTGNQLLNQVFSQKKMLIVKDVEDYFDKEEIDIYRFGKWLSLDSFAVTPLFNKDISIGVLTIGYHSDGAMLTGDDRTIELPSHPTCGDAAKDEKKRIGEKDCLLLESISNFVRDVLVKIELFQGMEQQIEKRTQELTKINDELLRTKELAIQSEKLSSLGRMAAGVIHQINDSLNFLVNILPDLRRDLQGLEKVKNLTVECITEPNAVSEIDGIMQAYDLEAHLQEMNFVFDRAENALNKGTRIAGSLNVFTPGSRQEENEIVNLLETAQEAVEMIPKKILGETQITVREEAECNWTVNRSEMQQVIINLVNNAIDAMEKKGAIEIRGERKKQTVVVSICDTGPGIPPEIQNRIFDPFFTTKAAGRGTGLGLSISAEIVRKSGGNLTVESIEGKGTCFHIRFHEDL